MPEELLASEEGHGTIDLVIPDTLRCKALARALECRLESRSRHNIVGVIVWWW
jgi:hypothetical protein